MQVRLLQYHLLCQNVQHATLHSCLKVTWGSQKAARDDYEDVI